MWVLSSGLKFTKQNTENIVIGMEALQSGSKIDPLLLLFCDYETMKHVCSETGCKNNKQWVCYCSHNNEGVKLK